MISNRFVNAVVVSAGLGLSACSQFAAGPAGPSESRTGDSPKRLADVPHGSGPTLTGGEAINLVVTSRDVSRQDESFYQYNFKMLEGDRIIEPDGRFVVRMELPPTDDGSPPMINGVVWETFEPWVSVVPPGLWHPYTKIPNRRKPGELVDCTIPLRLPRDDMAGFLPAGSKSARVTLDFRCNDRRKQTAAETLPELPLRPTQGGLVPPQTAAEKMRLEAVADSGSEIAVQAGLQDGRGEFTLPAGDYSVSVTAFRAGETVGPANAESYSPVTLAEPPLRIGKRFGVWKGEEQTGARLEYWTRLYLARERLAEALPPGTGKAWLRVAFRGDGDGPPLVQTLAVSLRGR